MRQDVFCFRNDSRQRFTAGWIQPRKIALGGATSQGKVLCATVTNCSIGKCEGAELLIRDPKGKKFMFVSQHLQKVELVARREGDSYIVTLPTLDARTQGTVFCDE